MSVTCGESKRNKKTTNLSLLSASTVPRVARVDDGDADCAKNRKSQSARNDAAVAIGSFYRTLDREKLTVRGAKGEVEDPQDAKEYPHRKEERLGHGELGELS